MSDASNYDWAEALRQRWIMHIPTRVTGRVTGIDMAGAIPTVTLQAGHTLVAIEENFIALTDREVKFFECTEQALAEVILGLAAAAMSTGIAMPTGTMLIVNALRQQADILDARRHANQEAAQ